MARDVINFVEKKYNNKAILTILFFGVLVGALDISIVGPALPSIKETFKIDNRSISWLFSIYILFNISLIPIMSKLTDIIGRRIVYVISLFVFGIGSLIVGFSTSFEMMLVGRAVQGAASSGIFPSASAIIADIFPPEKRGSALGLMGAVWGIAFIIGPVTAGLLISQGWHILFLINIPICIILILLSFKLLPNIKHKPEGKLDIFGLILIPLMLAAFAYGINSIDVRHFLLSLESAKVLLLFEATIILLLLVLYFENKASDPIIQLKNFKSKQVKLVSIIAIGTGVYMAIMAFIPDYAVKSFGVSFSKASFMMMPLILAMAVSSPISGRLLDKIGSRIIVVTGAGLMSAGLFVFCISSSSVWIFYGSGILIGLGLAMLLGAPLRYIMFAEVPATQRGSIQGTLNIFVSIGQLAGASAVGALVSSMGESVEAYSFSYFTIALMSVVILILAMFLKGRKKELETLGIKK